MEALHLNREWLELKYVVEGLSTYDIAAIVGRNPKRIYEKLKAFGIPTRPRGLNLKGADNFMRAPGVQNPMLGKKHTRKTRAVLRVKASVPKPYLRGKRNGMCGRCGPLNPNFINGATPERQRLYASAAWRQIVRLLRKRDGYVCGRCGAEKRDRGLHAHHVRSWSRNELLRFDLSNIVTLCRLCHLWVHSKKNVTKQFLA